MDYTDQQVAKIVGGVLREPSRPDTLVSYEWIWMYGQPASKQGPSMEYLADPHNEGIRLRERDKGGDL